MVHDSKREYYIYIYINTHAYYAYMNNQQMYVYLSIYLRMYVCR